MSQLAKTAQLETFMVRFQKFQEIPEFLEFLNSDCRIIELGPVTQIEWEKCPIV